MRPEDWQLGSGGGQQQAQLKHEVKGAARIESRVEMVPVNKQVVVLELSPQEAQTVYAICNRNIEAARAVREVGASSPLRKVRDNAAEDLLEIFRRLQPVLLKLNPGEIS